MNTLLSQIKEDVTAWLGRAATLFANERHQQVELASYLRLSGHYDEIVTEYFVPGEELKPGYAWDSELRLDIVVRRSGEYAAVELKYKTRVITGPIVRFGENLGDRPYTVVKSHGAQDLGMYDFWKDVRRLELVKSRFANVVGGIALFMTNDPYYRKGPKADAACAGFSMAGGTHGRSRNWTRDTSTTKGHPPFTLDSEYALNWSGCLIDDIRFDYIILTV